MKQRLFDCKNLVQSRFKIKFKCSSFEGWLQSFALNLANLKTKNRYLQRNIFYSQKIRTNHNTAGIQ